jgi:GR25 family glycosyltransferase involved in LPS biosynthesis
MSPLVVTDSRSRETPAAGALTGAVPPSNDDDQPLQGETLREAALVLDRLTSRLEDLFNLRDTHLEAEHAPRNGGIAKTLAMPAGVVGPAPPAPNGSAAGAFHAAQPGAASASPPRPLRAFAGTRPHQDLSGGLADWSTNGVIASAAPYTINLTGSPGNQGQTGLFVSSPEIPVEPDIFFELTIVGEAKLAGARLFIFAHDPTVGIDLVCRDLKLVRRTQFRERIVFRTLHRAKTISLRILVPKAVAGDQLRLERVILTRLGPTKTLAPEAATGRAVSMATVVGREEMLLDAVSTLYNQVDRIRIYLNGSTDAPTYLDDPRIELAWSRDHGDSGDMGKFFWADDKSPGYRFVVDDDFIFPANFIERMALKLETYGRRAVVGVHAILLRQPFKDYYDPRSRLVNRCAIALGQDLNCNVLGTGAICYDPKIFVISKNEFQYKNMADLWVMSAAQRQGLPLVAISRPHNWLIDNVTTDPKFNSIYLASATRGNNAFNTAEIQSHIARSAWPVTIRPRCDRGRCVPRVAAVFESGDVSAFRRSFASWMSTRPRDIDWVLIVVVQSRTAAADEAIRDVVVQAEAPFETHFVSEISSGRSIGAQETLELIQRIAPEGALWFRSGVRWIGNRWSELIGEALQSDGPVVLRASGAGADNPLAVCWSRGFTDSIVGQSRAAPRARSLWQLIQSALPATSDASTSALDHQRVAEATDLEPWPEAVPEEAPAKPSEGGKTARQSPAGSGTIRINDVFKRVLVLNLDRRPDRLQQFSRQAKKHRLLFERFPAVDGSKAPVSEDWAAYARSPVQPYPRGTGTFKYEYDFYYNYVNDLQRAAHLEERDKKKVLSRGAWGYLLSMIQILRRAIAEDWESVVVFDDDCRFHCDLSAQFDRIMRVLPADWMLLSMGALQYNWTPKWISWYDRRLYHCNGSSVGSHATAIHRSAFPMLLMKSEEMMLPFDVGALHTVKRMFATRCFVMYPNLFIQDTTDTDIGDSAVQLSEAAKPDNVYRWRTADYEGPLANSASRGSLLPSRRGSAQLANAGAQS